MSHLSKSELHALVENYERQEQLGADTHFSEAEYVQLVRYFAQQGQFNRGLDIIEVALAVYRYSGDLQQQKVELLIDANQPALALRALDDLMCLSPNSSELVLLKAEIFGQLDRHEEALELLHDFEITCDRDLLPEVLLVKASLQHYREDWSALWDSCREIAEQDPAQTECLELVMSYFDHTKDYVSCCAFHQKIIDRAPYNFQAWYNLGHAYTLRGKYSEAVEAYDYALLINEDYFPAYQDCAELSFELQRYERALQYGLDIEQRFGADSELYLHIGKCYHELGKLKPAQAYLLLSIRQDPFNDEAQYFLGLIQNTQENWRAAITYFQRAIDIEPGREEYHAGLGEAAWETDQLELADRSFRRATELAPDQPWFWVQYAMFLIGTGAAMKALDLLEIAEENCEGNELHYTHIACLFLLGQRREALYQLGEALEEAYDDHRFLFQLCPDLELDHDIIMMIGRYGRA